jgi:hypothetical protein
MDALSRLDLVFCVDITSSMTPFIDAARAQMLRILEELRGALGEGLRVAVVAYRDHGSEPLLETSPFGTSAEDTTAFLKSLLVRSAPSNTDSAEAVFTGLAACVALPWREGAYRTLVLVGDAPPHACGANAPPFPDRFPTGDPSGFDLDGMANRLEEEGIFLHALAMVPSLNRHHDAVLERAFERLAVSTGGSYRTPRTAEAAMEIVEVVSKRFLQELDLDRRLFAALGGGASGALAPEGARVTPLAKELACAEGDVNAGLMRLRQRRLLA